MNNTFAYPPPNDGKPFRLNMGLRELDVQNWIEGGPDLSSQLNERNKIFIENRNQVFQLEAGHEMAATIFAEQIITNLGQYHPDYAVAGPTVRHIPTKIEVDITEDHPFIQLAKVIAEDLCLLYSDHGKWRLVAAVVIFPSRWNLLEKIGKNIDDIHIPVPGYDQALKPFMSETFNKVRVDRPVWRKNWSLHESSLLHEPFYAENKVPAKEYWWRTERQTLTASSDKKYLLFTIRNRSEPLIWIKSDPESAKQFATTLASLSPQMLEYKHLVEKRDELINYLNQ
jgi:hypothetical protein